MSAIDDLLLNGRLNRITFGMDIGGVIGAVGQPDHRLQRKSLNVLKYGSIELGFLEAAEGAGSRLATINFYFGSGDKRPEWLDAGEWLVSEGTTVGQFREYLQSINLRLRSEIPAEPNEYLITETGVRASFVNGRLRIIHAAKDSYTPVKTPAPTALTLGADVDGAASADDGDIKQAYEKMKSRFRSTSFEDFKSGTWFAQFVRWMLENYARTANAGYWKRAYPGAAPSNLAKKIIATAAKHNGVAGATSAAAITALELSSFGPQALVTVSAVGSVLATDVAFCTRTQLRAIYDLSVIHDAPLSIDDVEDCYLVFCLALGIKIEELIAGAGKALGPQVAVFNVRKLLRSGLRAALQAALKKIGGVQLARKLTERAMLRLLVPGIAVPIASGFNYYFTKKLLYIADRQMRQRGAIVRPIVRLHAREPELDKTFVPKLLIAIADLGGPNAWCQRQLDCLRHCQTALMLSDAELKDLDAYFDRSLADVIKELPVGFRRGGDDLLQIAHIQAAFADNDAHDAKYADAIVNLARALGKDLPSKGIDKTIRDLRNEFR